MADDFITTIDSDDEVSNYGEPSGLPKIKDDELDPDFEFDFGGGRSEGLDLWGGDEVQGVKKGNEVRSIGQHTINPTADIHIIAYQCRRHH